MPRGMRDPDRTCVGEVRLGRTRLQQTDDAAGRLADAGESLKAKKSPGRPSLQKPTLGFALRAEQACARNRKPSGFDVMMRIASKSKMRITPQDLKKIAFKPLVVKRLSVAQLDRASAF